MLKHAEPEVGVADVVRLNLRLLDHVPYEQRNALAGTAPADVLAWTTPADALAGTASADLELEAPHRVYTLGLDDLDAGSDLTSAHADGWRYLLRQKMSTVAAAWVIEDADGDPILAEFNSGPFVQSTVRALKRAESIVGGVSVEVFEPRLLHVPALHAMALWLHGGGQAADVVIPLSPTLPHVQKDRNYSVEEYLKALRHAVESIDPVEADCRTTGS